MQIERLADHPLRAPARTGLSASFLLLVMSAWSRTSASGIGCSPWPDCYGHPGTIQVAWFSVIRWALAALLLSSVLILCFRSARNRDFRLQVLLILLAAILQAYTAIGLENPATPGAHLAFIMCGYAAVAAMGWLVFRFEPAAPGYTSSHTAWVRPLLFAAIAALALQILLGALTSANHAALACTSLLDCTGGWWPDATIHAALKLQAAGQDLPLIAIHRAHRLGAIVAGITLLAAVAASFSSIESLHKPARRVVFLLLAQFALAIAMVLTPLPDALTLFHNVLALLLLLTLMQLLHRSRHRPLPLPP